MIIIASLTLAKEKLDPREFSSLKKHRKTYLCGSSQNDENSNKRAYLQ